jgi:hypothetical protein
MRICCLVDLLLLLVLLCDHPYIGSHRACELFICVYYECLVPMFVNELLRVVCLGVHYLLSVLLVRIGMMKKVRWIGDGTHMCEGHTHISALGIPNTYGPPLQVHGFGKKE